MPNLVPKLVDPSARMLQLQAQGCVVLSPDARDGYEIRNPEVGDGGGEQSTIQVEAGAK